MTIFAVIPFWGWLLLSVGCGIVYVASIALADSKRGLTILSLGILSAFAGFLCLLIGAVRFVKLVWA